MSETDRYNHRTWLTMVTLVELIKLGGFWWWSLVELKHRVNHRLPGPPFIHEATPTHSTSPSPFLLTEGWPPKQFINFWKIKKSLYGYAFVMVVYGLQLECFIYQGKRTSIFRSQIVHSCTIISNIKVCTLLESLSKMSFNRFSTRKVGES